MKKLTLVIGIILASVISAVCAENNTPEFLYQKGLYLETAKADYEGAVKVYEKIIKEHEKNAEFVAKSLYRAGICYEKLGKSGEAGKAFNKLGNDYAKYLDSIEGASQKVSASTQNPLIEKLKKKVSLRFVNAPIESVLSYLSSACGVNILIDAQALRSIDTRVSISMKDISVRQALEVVLRMRGLSYQVKEEYIWVSTPDKIQLKKSAGPKQTVNALLETKSDFAYKDRELKAEVSKYSKQLKEGKSYKERKLAAGKLCHSGDKSVVPLLLEVLKNKEEYNSVRCTIAGLLWWLEDKSAVPVLIEVLKDKSEDYMLRVQCIASLRYLRDKRSIPVLIEMLKDENRIVKRSAAQALGMLSDKSAIPALTEALKDEEIRVKAAYALAFLGDHAVVPILIELLEKKDRVARMNTAMALSKLGGKDVLDALKNASEKETDAQVLLEIEKAIRRIEGY